MSLLNRLAHIPLHQWPDVQKRMARTNEMTMKEPGSHHERENAAMPNHQDEYTEEFWWHTFGRDGTVATGRISKVHRTDRGLQYTACGRRIPSRGKVEDYPPVLDPYAARCRRCFPATPPQQPLKPNKP